MDFAPKLYCASRHEPSQSVPRLTRADRRAGGRIAAGESNRCAADVRSIRLARRPTWISGLLRLRLSFHDVLLLLADRRDDSAAFPSLCPLWPGQRAAALAGGAPSRRRMPLLYPESRRSARARGFVWYFVGVNSRANDTLRIAVASKEVGGASC